MKKQLPPWAGLQISGVHVAFPRLIFEALLNACKEDLGLDKARVVLRGAVEQNAEQHSEFVLEGVKTLGFAPPLSPQEYVEAMNAILHVEGLNASYKLYEGKVVQTIDVCHCGGGELMVRMPMDVYCKFCVSTTKRIHDKCCAVACRLRTPQRIALGADKCVFEYVLKDQE